MRPGDPGWGEDPDDLLVYDSDGRETRRAATAGDQRSYYAAMLAALHGSGANPVTPLQALTTMAVLEAVATSARTHASIDVPMTEDEMAQWR
jgi:predicted dehydrogenase